jgi:hypothetical protein
MTGDGRIVDEDKGDMSGRLPLSGQTMPRIEIEVFEPAGPAQSQRDSQGDSRRHGNR